MATNLGSNLAFNLSKFFKFPDVDENPSKNEATTKTEALRFLLAGTALTITALLTSPQLSPIAPTPTPTPAKLMETKTTTPENVVKNVNKNSPKTRKKLQESQFMNVAFVHVRK